MSYCRFIEADAYIYASSRGLDCCGCAYAKRTPVVPPRIDFLGIPHEYDYEDVYFETAQEMLDHVAFHRAQGDHIPLDVDERIREDYPDLNAYAGPSEEELEAERVRNEARRERMVAKMREANQS